MEDLKKSVLIKGDNIIGFTGRGVIPMTQEEFNALPPEKQLNGSYYITDGTDEIVISDNEISEKQLWSSKKISDEVAEVESKVDGLLDNSSTSETSTWSSSKIAQQINSATTIKYDNVINANATKETDWSLAQGESHFYGRLLQLDGHLGSKSSTFSFLLFVKANYDNPTTVYVTQLAGMDDDRTNIAHTTYFELGVSSSGNLTIKNKSAVAASYRFI
jgi:hypothetical protein